MICAKPGSHFPSAGQTVYVLSANGEPIAAALSFPAAVAAMQPDYEIKEVTWLG